MGKAKTPPNRKRPTKRGPGRAVPSSPGSFAHAVSLEELIRQQGVKPITDLGELAGMWPEDFQPGEFLKWLEEERSARRRLAHDRRRG